MSSTGQEAHQWEQALDALASGQIISVPYSDARERMALLRAFSHRARARGFRLEHRGADGVLALRRV